MACTKSKY